MALAESKAGTLHSECLLPAGSLHMHTEMSAALYRGGLSRQFLVQHSHLGLCLHWKGLQQC